MGTEILLRSALLEPPITPPAVARPTPTPPDLVALALEGLSATSRETYRQSYRDFAAFAGVTEPVALGRLIRLEQGDANGILLAYLADLDRRHLAPATRRIRVAALKRAVARARMVGITTITLEATAPRAEAFRDTQGPGRSGWERLLERARSEAAQGQPLGVRNLALVILLHDRALRRAEVAGLDLVDVDLTRPAVHVLGKGKSAREWLTINDRTRQALEAWLALRGDRPGPVFHRADMACRNRPAEPRRIDPESINRAVKALTIRAGLGRVVRAHGLRHGGITDALDAGWDVRDVRQFSRHAKIDTVLIYDDRRRDLGGEITRSLGAERPRRKRPPCAGK